MNLFCIILFQVESITDSVQDTLKQLQNGTITKLPDAQYKDYKKRKLLIEVYVLLSW